MKKLTEKHRRYAPTKGNQEKKEKEVKEEKKEKKEKEENACNYIYVTANMDFQLV